MPRHPRTGSSVAAIGGAVYSSLVHRLSMHEGEIYPLHVGDTWLEPAPGCRMEDLRVEEHPGMHRYAPPRGLAALLDGVAARTFERSGVPTAADEVLITTGATGGLGAVVGAITEPGDEILVLAPYWPLITGIVRCYHARPVVVPLIGEADSATAAVDLVERHRTERTVALYVSTPNNPTGKVLPREWVSSLAAWCARNGLWILSDEVYEDYVYRGEHTYCRAIDPERTFSAHSFSKAFGMAGNRCGYVIGPRSVMGEICKVSTHAFYSTPTASQLAACRALDGRGDAWIRDVKPHYAETGERAAARLGVDPPEGSTFLFLDVRDHLNGAALPGFLERCADRGLLLAPGPSFGPYPTHVRLCFTSVAPDVVGRGVEVLADLLGR